MGVLDWLNDSGLFGASGDPEAGAQAAVAQMTAAPPIAPGSPPQDAPAPSATPPAADTPSPVDMSTQPNPAAGFGGAAQPPVPLPVPRPPGAPGPSPAALNANGAAPGASAAPAATPSPAAPPGPPLPITSPAQNAPAFNPSMLGRMFGVTSADQAAKYGQQTGAGLAAGLKSVGTNWNKPGLAAFAGSMGSAMEGGQARADIQTKQAADNLKAAIDAKKAGDEQGYKTNYLQYLAAKLKADTDKAASKDATTTNKNDTPTQLYLSAQRLVQNDPEVVDARKALESARKTGEPADVTAATNRLQQVLQQKQAEHLAGVGLHPQTAAQIAKQPGNSQENPVNGKAAGLTPENITKKLQPGQWFTNPADGKLYQFKGAPEKKDSGSKTTPDVATKPEPANPMNKSEVSAGSTKKSDDDDED